MARMDGPSFAGLAGEVIRDFVHPARAIRSLPALVLVGLAGTAGVATGTYALGLPGLALPLLMWLFVAPVLGSEALAARFGGRASVGDALAFAARLGAMGVLWGVPLFSIAHRLVGDDALSGGALTAATWPRIAGICLLIVAALTGVTVSTAMAAACDTLAEVFTPRRWRWLLGQHRGDLPALIAATLGGVALFYLGALPIALGLGWLLVRWSAYAGVACALAGYLSPLAAGAILAARLAGTLARTRDAADSQAIDATVYATGEDQPVALDVRPRRTPAPPRPRPQRTPPASSPVPGADAMAFIHTFQSLPAKADDDLDGAVREAEALAAEAPHSAGIHAELAKLYRRAGRDDDAVQAGGRAITVALNGGMSPVAVEVYRSFAAQRQRLALSATTLAALGKTLRQSGHPDDAEWCLAQADRD